MSNMPGWAYGLIIAAGALTLFIIFWKLWNKVDSKVMGEMMEGAGK